MALARVRSSRLRWVLIGLIGLWATAHIGWFPEASQLDRNSYDQMVKRRLVTPPADPSIIIVDIDERSLEKMKDEFGRWPWPRETLASVYRDAAARRPMMEPKFPWPTTSGYLRVKS